MKCALAETALGLLMQEKERLEFTPAPKSKRAWNHKRLLRPNVDRWEMFDRGDPTSSGHSIPTNLSSHYRRQTYSTSLQWSEGPKLTVMGYGYLVFCPGTAVDIDARTGPGL